MGRTAKKESKSAHKAESTVMAANDSAELGKSPMKCKSTMTIRSSKRVKTPPVVDKPTTLALKSPQGKVKVVKTVRPVIAPFTEGDQDVEVEVDAPTGVFMSDGEVQTSESDSDEGNEPMSSQYSTDQRRSRSQS